MATDKTTSLRTRVPVEVAKRLQEDANDLGMAPGTLVRRILEGRYAVPRKAGKSVNNAGKTDIIETED